MKKTIVIGVMLILLGIAAMPNINAINVQTNHIKNDDTIHGNPVEKTVGGPDIEWDQQINYGSTDFGREIHQTSDGGYIFLGSIGDNFQGYLSYIAKLNSDGELIWEKTINNVEISLRSIKETENYYVFGGILFKDDNADFLLLKMDKTGYIISENSYGTNETEYLSEFILTSDGGYIFNGRVLGHGDNDSIVIKVDQNDLVEWQKLYDFDPNDDTGDDHFISVIETSDGGLIFSGQCQATNSSNYNVWLLKTDSWGNIIWQQTYDYSGIDWGYDILEVSDGYVLLVKMYCEDCRMHILKVDKKGHPLWIKEYYVYPDKNDDDLVYIKQTSDGGFILTGEVESPVGYLWVLKIDSNGYVEWEKILDDTEGYTGGSGNYIEQTDDGGYILTGKLVTEKSFSTHKSDIWVIKFGSDGEGSGFTPMKPSGPTTGEPGSTYTYSTSMQHPDGLDVQFGWDWNGDHVVDEWTDDWYGSGESCVCVHTWEDKGVYQVCVKAKDTTGMESRWSDPLSVSMPKARVWSMSVFQLFDDYPFVQQLFWQLLQQ